MNSDPRRCVNTSGPSRLHLRRPGTDQGPRKDYTPKRTRHRPRSCRTAATCLDSRTVLLDDELLVSPSVGYLVLVEDAAELLHEQRVVRVDVFLSRLGRCLYRTHAGRINASESRGKPGQLIDRIVMHASIIHTAKAASSAAQAVVRWRLAEAEGHDPPISHRLIRPPISRTRRCARELQPMPPCLPRGLRLACQSHTGVAVAA